MNSTTTSYINGEWHSMPNASTIALYNPGDLNQKIAMVSLADSSVAEKAMMTAQAAWKKWRKIPIERRAKLLEELLHQIILAKETFAEIITKENGKTLNEARAEVTGAVAEGKYQLQFLKSHLEHQEGNAILRYEPLGVVLLITPWNFPLATITRKLIPALIAGNTLVLKASEITPLTACALFQIIDKIGFEAGVANLLIGIGEAVGPTLLQHPALKALSFTGSNPTGEAIVKLIGSRNIKFQAEMGGANAVVILKDADIQAAVEAVISNRFACCGQWCTGTGRVIIEKEIYDEVISLLQEKAAAIQVGYGRNAASNMGPLTSETQFAKIKQQVALAVEQGAKIQYGGNPATVEGYTGYYFEPTILTGIVPEMAIAQEEVFGPVLLVMQAKDIQDALRISNNTELGLSFSIYTSDEAAAHFFMDNVEAGLCHINLPTAHRSYAMPLFGWKKSGRGIPECGRFMLDLFTQPKVIYR